MGFRFLWVLLLGSRARLIWHDNPASLVCGHVLHATLWAQLAIVEVSCWHEYVKGSMKVALESSA